MQQQKIIQNYELDTTKFHSNFKRKGRKPFSPIVYKNTSYKTLQLNNPISRTQMCVCVCTYIYNKKIIQNQELATTKNQANKTITTIYYIQKKRLK